MTNTQVVQTLGLRRSLHSAIPDFLSRFVALSNFMRLSLLEATGNPGERSEGVCSFTLRH
jgi:hypothetical protein